ncbi:MAG: sigma-70 family RNA polymerase sigma factor [Acidobacteriota bacterium]
MGSPTDVTKMLMDWRKGDKTALDRLLPIVYSELHSIASRYLCRERSNHTLQTTALVHEAYLRLANEENIQWQNRTHFFAVAALLMRRILVDYAVAHKAEKRGGNIYKLPLDEAIGLPQKRDMDILALNDALNDLALMDARKSQIVELRFFAGLSNEEIAEAMDISLSTVNREWRMVKAWLYNEIIKDGRY